MVVFLPSVQVKECFQYQMYKAQVLGTYLPEQLALSLFQGLLMSGSHCFDFRLYHLRFHLNLLCHSLGLFNTQLERKITHLGLNQICKSLLTSNHTFRKRHRVTLLRLAYILNKSTVQNL